MADDKIGVVTGANAGIGKEITKGLAMEDYHVVMVGRSEKRLQTAREEIITQTGQDSLQIEKADLASFREVFQLADRLKKQVDQLDLVINNAGLITTERQITEDGNELTLQVNYLSHFLLTHELLPLLKTGNEESRLLNVSSGLHRVASIYFDDLHLEEKYSAVKAYGQSKLALILFTYELDRRLEDENLTVNAVNPGAVGTQFASKNSSGLLKYFWKLYSYFIKDAAGGADTPLYAATSSDLKGVSGKFFKKRKAKKTSSESYDEKVAQKLWEISVELTGVKAKV